MPQQKRHGLWPQWNIFPTEKALWFQCNIPLRFQPQWKRHGFMKNCKEIHYKRYNFNQNKFYALHDVDKSNLNNNFQRIYGGLYFLLLFPFHYHCQLVNSQLQQKSSGGGGCSSTQPPPPPRDFYWPDLQPILKLSFLSLTGNMFLTKIAQIMRTMNF